MSDNNRSFDDTCPLLGISHSFSDVDQHHTMGDSMNSSFLTESPIPDKHVASLLEAFGSTDLDLAHDVLKVQKVDSVRAAYFRQGRAVLAKSGRPKTKKSRAVQFQALTAAFEILSNPFWRNQYEREYRFMHQKVDLSLSTSMDSAGPVAMRRTKTWSPGKSRKMAQAQSLLDETADEEEGDAAIVSPNTSVDRAFSSVFVTGAFEGGTDPKHIFKTWQAFDAPFSRLSTATLITPPVSPGGRCEDEVGTPAKLILEDLMQPSRVKVNKKKNVQFDLGPIVKRDKEETRSNMDGKESLLDNASATPSESVAGTQGSSSDCSAFTDGESFLAHVKNAMTEGIGKASEEANTATATIGEYWKKFSEQVAAARSKLSKEIAPATKAVVEALNLPDENIAGVCNVIGAQKFEHVLQNVEEDLKNATRSLPHSFTM